ncbi:protein FATTY ACID EXPORT 3, chloroplastic-like [Cucurbita maxima]|uniref:Protein FATTY ACID EXPORT 3, chloroplastic-like n=1 Tax=Cucurbita maxima TaxID=3661 RepID=A0A6J1IPG5_CUCMA|nr:protein FATTY ACID EXPORT 3, chloroplastic-like [Cucurbita maxima]
MESLLVLNPTPSPGHPSPLKFSKSAAVPVRYHPNSSLRLDPLMGYRACKVSSVASTLTHNGFLSPYRRCALSQRVMVFSASHEESHSESQGEKDGKDINFDAEKPQELWKKALDSFKEQALKMKAISKEAYEEYSAKALVALKETSKLLKIQADKAKNDLNFIMQECGEECKEYIATVAENCPEEVKEIVETFTSPTADLSDISKLQDFHYGIPYGLVLSCGGFLSFMITGSLFAVRFGMIPGGALLALSVLSLQSYKRGQSLPLALKGQTAIASILFLRELRLVFQRPSFVNLLTTLISATMVLLYVRRIMLNARIKKQKDF